MTDPYDERARHFIHQSFGMDPFKRLEMLAASFRELGEGHSDTLERCIEQHMDEVEKKDAEIRTLKKVLAEISSVGCQQITLCKGKFRCVCCIAKEATEINK